MPLRAAAISKSPTACGSASKSPDPEGDGRGQDQEHTHENKPLHHRHSFPLLPKFKHDFSFSHDAPES